MAPQFTEAVAKAIEEAFQYAQAKSHTEVTENHLLRSLLLEPQGLFLERWAASCQLHAFVFFCICGKSFHQLLVCGHCLALSEIFGLTAVNLAPW